MKIRYLTLALGLASAAAFAQQAAPAAPAGAAPMAAPIGPAPIATGVAPQVGVRTMPMSPADLQFMARERELTRQLRLAQLEAQIAEAKRKASEAETPKLPPLDATGLPPLGNMPGTQGPTATGVAAALAAPKPAADVLTFSLMSVWGTDGAYQADVASNGLRVTVRDGDQLPGGWEVARIARTGMLIRRGKATKMLRVGG